MKKIVTFLLLAIIIGGSLAASAGAVTPAKAFADTTSFSKNPDSAAWNSMLASVGSWFGGIKGRISGFFGHKDDGDKNQKKGTITPSQNLHPIFRPVPPFVTGIVVSINGTTITITPASTTSMTFTVNAAHAKIVKSGTTTSLSSINTGDKLFVKGLITGTTVTATDIFDGAIVPLEFRQGEVKGEKVNVSGPSWKGTVSAVNGSTFTIQFKGGMEISKKDKEKKAEPPTATRKVVTTDQTTFLNNDKNASLADVTVNKMVSVVGTFDAKSNTISATKVTIIR